MKLIGSNSRPDGMRTGFVSGNTAWQIALDHLNIWDVTATPEYIGQIPFDGWAALSNYAQGQSAWITDSLDNFSYFDLSHPHSPRQLSSVTTSDGFAPMDIAKAGNELTLLEWGWGYGLNVSSGSNFTSFKKLDIPFTRAMASRVFEEITTSGTRGYMMSRGSGLVIAGLSDPLHPRELGQFPAEYFSRVAINGDYAYIGKSTNGGEIIAIDAKIPKAPQFVTSAMVD